jgi:hypothetical protein
MAYYDSDGLKQYQIIHTTCFRPAKEEGLASILVRQERSAEYEAKANSRSIASLKAGVRRGNVDDTLEFGIRYMLTL